MSIIVCVRKNGHTVMAADTLTCFGDAQQVPAPNSVTPKIRRLGASVVGASGWAVYDCILSDFLHDRPVPDLDDEQKIFAFFVELWKAMRDRYTFVNDQAQAKDSPFADLDSSFLVSNRNGIFKVSGDLDVSRFDRYFAIGSGAEYALGALHALWDLEPCARTIARRAVETAIAFDLYCGGEVAVEEVPAFA